MLFGYGGWWFCTVVRSTPEESYKEGNIIYACTYELYMYGTSMSAGVKHIIILYCFDSGGGRDRVGGGGFSF